MTIFNIPLERVIANPWQTRQSQSDPAYIEDLAADIRRNGLLQLPVGRITGAGGQPVTPDVLTQEIVNQDTTLYIQLAFGHNRLAAFELLDADGSQQWQTMPVEVGPLADEQMANFAWSENEKRRDCSPLERALAIQKRMESFGWSQQEVADRLGISRPVVTNALRLLKLPEEVRQKLDSGEINERQAQAVLALFDLPESLRAKGAAGWNVEINPTNILDDALTGVSSEEIRRRIDKLIDQYCKDLHTVIWKLDDALNGICPCRTCESRMASRNACMDPDCYRIKERLAKADYLSKASQASGIPPLESDKDYHSITRFEWGSAKQDLPKILKAGCKSLRLCYEHRETRNHQADDSNTLAGIGFPHASIVCAKRAGYCTCSNGLDHIRSQAKAQIVYHSTSEQPSQDANSESPDSPPAPIADLTAAGLEEQARAARAEKRRASKLANQVKRLAAARLAQALEDNSPLAWRVFAAGLLWSFSWDKTNDYSFTDLCYAFGEAAVEKLMPYDPTSLSHILKSINQRLRQAGLPPISEGEVLEAEEEIAA
jgi:ParB/RepB/Spo0J family partition protein